MKQPRLHLPAREHLAKLARTLAEDPNNPFTAAERRYWRKAAERNEDGDQLDVNQEDEE